MRTRLWLLPLLCASLACGSLAPRAQATNTPGPATAPAATLTAEGPTPAAPTATVDVATVPPEATAEGAQAEPLVDLLNVVRAKIKSGEMERGAAIAAGLRVFAGEAAAEDVFGPGPIHANEGTGLIRLGKQYLESGADAAAKAEIERLLNFLLPPIDELDRFAQPLPGQSAGEAAHRARLLARPLGYQTLCSGLWRGGFSSPTTELCYEYATRVIDGVTHRIYVPASWPAGDPRRDLLDLALQALEDSLAIFNGYGPNPVMATRLVLTDLPGLDNDGNPDPDTYAAAAPSRSGNVCLMGIFPTGAELDPEPFKQNLAHELFHCYQYTNLTEQEDGPDHLSNAWWVEGSAEYYSNVVYPSTNLEFEWAAGFDEVSSTTPVLDMTYESYLFFMHLAEQAGLGHEGVIDLLRSMPISGDFAEQQDNLSLWPGMDDLFHQFAKDYLDRALEDTGSGRVPVNPTMHDPQTFILGGGSLDFNAPSFMVARYRLFWEPHGDFEMSTRGEDSNSTYTARPTSDQGAWAEVPATMRSSCEVADYLLLLTSAQPTGGTDAHLSIDYSGEEAQECDPCLVGHWTQDIAGLRPVMEGFMPADSGMQLDILEGTFHLNVTDSGFFEYYSEGYVLQYLRQEDDGTDVFHYDNHLASAGAWGSTDNSILSTWDTDSTVNSRLTATVNGETFTQDMAAGGPGFTSPFAADSSFPYVCTETTLTVLPAAGMDVPFSEWVYVKSSP